VTFTHILIKELLTTHCPVTIVSNWKAGVLVRRVGLAKLLDRLHRSWFPGPSCAGFQKFCWYITQVTWPGLNPIHV